MEETVLFWFRRDLRMDDNHGLYKALKSGYKVIPIFVFDPHILGQFEDKDNRQVDYIINAVFQLKNQLVELNSDLKIFYDAPENVFNELLKTYNIKAVYANEDFEPSTIKRDLDIADFLKSKNVNFRLFNDHVVFAPGTILKSDQTPYVVFTPFSKIWKQSLLPEMLTSYPVEELLQNLYHFEETSTFDFQHIGFSFSLKKQKPIEIPISVIVNYHDTWNFPAIDKGTTKMGVHLRFGTISIRKLVAEALIYNEVFLSELIWREFFIHILYHFPYVANQSFRNKYNSIVWNNNEKDFENWCIGNTGVPLVDAGMRELNQTGFMHNRVRMVVGSYLVKHLLIDWRWGEAYFAQKLIDFELSSNNGNWQWVAGTGCDAAPYFRIFNPYRQQERFDPKFEYIAKWVPDYQSEEYKKVFSLDLKMAKERCLKAYKACGEE